MVAETNTYGRSQGDSQNSAYGNPYTNPIGNGTGYQAGNPQMNGPTMSQIFGEPAPDVGWNPNLQSQQKFGEIAMSNNLTPWAVEQQRLGNMQFQNMQQQAQQQGNQMLASNVNQAAMKGGISSGARERMGMQTQEQIGDIWSQLGQKHMVNQQGVLTKDAALKAEMLKNLVGMDFKQAAMQQQAQEARLNAWAGVKTGELERQAAVEENDGCIITTTLNDMGNWTDMEKARAVIWCKRTHHDGSLRGKMWVDGYHKWGGFLAKLMRKNKVVRYLCQKGTESFVNHVTKKNKTLKGAFIKHFIVNPLSYVIGFFKVGV